MDEAIRTAAISPLRQRLIDDMNMRRFSRETQRNYIRDVGRFATFLGRSPDTATADDVRRFQIEQRDSGMPTPTMNSIVSALRFFFTHTIDRPDLARRLIRVAHPLRLRDVIADIGARTSYWLRFDLKRHSLDERNAAALANWGGWWLRWLGCSAKRCVSTRRGRLIGSCSGSGHPTASPGSRVSSRGFPKACWTRLGRLPVVNQSDGRWVAT
jgi:Phage integrase, N-terminal SAM-like domain